MGVGGGESMPAGSCPFSSTVISSIMPAPFSGVRELERRRRTTTAPVERRFRSDEDGMAALAASSSGVGAIDAIGAGSSLLDAPASLELPAVSACVAGVGTFDSLPSVPFFTTGAVEMAATPVCGRMGRLAAVLVASRNPNRFAAPGTAAAAGTAEAEAEARLSLERSSPSPFSLDAVRREERMLGLAILDIGCISAPELVIVWRARVTLARAV